MERDDGLNPALVRVAEALGRHMAEMDYHEAMRRARERHEARTGRKQAKPAREVSKQGKVRLTGPLAYDPSGGRRPKPMKPTIVPKGVRRRSDDDPSDRS